MSAPGLCPARLLDSYSSIYFIRQNADYTFKAAFSGIATIITNK